MSESAKLCPGCQRPLVLVELIGGPMDGERADLCPTTETIVIPLSLPVPGGPFTVAIPPLEESPTVHVYLQRAPGSALFDHAGQR